MDPNLLLVPPKVDSQLMERAVGLYLGGDVSALAAAKAVGIGECTLLRELKKRGVDVKSLNRARDTTPEQAQEILVKYRRAWPTKEIALVVGVHSATVTNCLKRLGEPLRERSARVTEDVRYCGLCQIEHPVSEFAKPSATECRAERNRRIAARRATNESVRAARSKATMTLLKKKRECAAALKNTPCVDCGSKYEFYAMEFDHVGPDKLASVASLVAAHRRDDVILEEIKKTEVVCVLCHRNRTIARSELNERSQSAQAVARRAGLQFIRSLKVGPCVDCGLTRNPWQMDFDHRPGEVKRYSISKMTNMAKETILAEVAKCDLVCALCHRRRTHQRNQYRPTSEGKQ